MSQRARTSSRALARQARVAVMLGALVGLLAGGCGKTSSCRPGTLFLNVKLGPFATANRLDVDVSVQGAAAQHSSLTLSSGVAAGGVEVQFPNGYPAGVSATVTLTLFSQGTEIAQQISTLELEAGCSAATIDFGGTDAGRDAPAGGAGGAAGTVGNGGAAGGGPRDAGDGPAGGTSGTSGMTGTAGAGGTAGVTGTAGATGTAGGGGAAGRGGASGAAGAAGRGGVSGAGGAAGRGGAGGSAGVGGAAGRGGTGGAACVPTPENCFNNIDDDCDGKIDCADPDCAPSVAQCVALDQTVAKVGIPSAQGCPSGYGSPTPILSNFIPGSCAGCSCQPGAVTCATTLSDFETLADCTAGKPGVAVGSWMTGQEGAACGVIPKWSTGTYIFGIATTAFTASAAGCTPAGSPTLTASTWGATEQFCYASATGGGCPTGQTCVPAAPPGNICQLYDGSHSCPSGTQQSVWFTSYSNGQGCGPCTCGAPTGASCANTKISIGSDYSCGSQNGAVGSADRACFSSSTSGVYYPGVQFVGTATAASCQALSAPTGNIAPTGPKTLCCI